MEGDTIEERGTNEPWVLHSAPVASDSEHKTKISVTDQKQKEGEGKGLLTGRDFLWA